MSAEGDAEVSGDRPAVYRQALEAFFAGDDATPAFAPLADQPGSGQQLAREYLSQPLPEPLDPTWEPTPAGLAVIGAAAAIGAGAYLRRFMGRRLAGQHVPGRRGSLVPAQRRAPSQRRGGTGSALIR